MNGQLALGIDIGGTNVKLALVNADGDVIASESVPTAPERGAEEFCRSVAKTAKDMAASASVPWADVMGVGVGIAAFLDVERGWVEEAVNLHWFDVPLGELFTKELGKSVHVDNDANVAALGEVWLGAGQNAKSALCVTLGTGVGGGIIIGGRIYRGVSTMAGEIGHITVKSDGELCNCGRHGCLETLSSATALARHGRQAGLVSPNGELDSKMIFEMAQAGNETAQGVIDEMIHWLAVGLSIGANLLNPDVIVIAGGVVNAGDALIDPLRTEFVKATLVRVSRMCKIVPATLGSQAGVLGAARLVLQHIESM